MWRFFRNVSSPAIKQHKKCHRIDCPCVAEIQERALNVIRTHEGHHQLDITLEKYRTCYALAKKWGHVGNNWGH